MIELDTINLEKIDYENKRHLEYLKELMQSKDINYLWDLSDERLLNNQNDGKYIVINDTNDYIGYLNISNPTEARYGKTVSLYYAVKEEYRGKQYGKLIIEEASDWLFNNQGIDCIVAQVDISNTPSIKTLTKAGMTSVSKDEEYNTFIQTKNR